MNEKLLKPEELGNVMVTVPDWFKGPDGKQYQSVYGPIQTVQAKDVLGFKPARSADWFLLVGHPGKQVAIAGCRIHYVGIDTNRVKAPHISESCLDLSKP